MTKKLPKALPSWNGALLPTTPSGGSKDGGSSADTTGNANGNGKIDPSSWRVTYLRLHARTLTPREAKNVTHKVPDVRRMGVPRGREPLSLEEMWEMARVESFAPGDEVIFLRCSRRFRLWGGDEGLKERAEKCTGCWYMYSYIYTICNSMCSPLSQIQNPIAATSYRIRNPSTLTPPLFDTFVKRPILKRQSLILNTQITTIPTAGRLRRSRRISSGAELGALARQRNLRRPRKALLPKRSRALLERQQLRRIGR